MEYYDATSNAIAELQWSSASQVKTIVAARNLSHVVGNLGANSTLHQLVTDDADIVRQTLGFNIPSAVNLLSSPPIITSYTDSVAEQQSVIFHRSAIEALSAILHAMSVSSGSSISTDMLIKLLAVDLSDDGIVNDSRDEYFHLVNSTFLSLDPNVLTIPNTGYKVSDTVSMIIDEQSLVSASSNIYIHENELSVNLQPSSLNIAGYNENETGEQVVNNTIESGDIPSETSTNLGGLVASGPIVINGEQDVVISGRRISNPNGTCIQIKNGASNIVIKDNEIGPCGEKGIDISGQSHHVSIAGNHIHDIQREAVMSYESYHISVDSNEIVDVESGYEMWTTSEGNLSFTNNYVKNVTRREESSNGGNVAVANFVRGGGVRINNNVAVNVEGESGAEDLVNIYRSHGNADDPIQIKNNIFVGGSPRASGTGIILGDKGASYIIAEGNKLVNPGSSGIFISGGHHITAINNDIYSTKTPTSWLGISVKDYYDSGTCSDIKVANNRMNWTSHDGTRRGGQDWGNCGSLSGWNTNDWDADIGNEIGGTTIQSISENNLGESVQANLLQSLVGAVSLW